MSGGSGGGKAAKASSNLQARIKKMMQSDEDVGKVAKASPVLIAKALDIFLQSMVDGAARIAEGRGARMLTASHIKAHIQGEELLDFLKDAVGAVPDLPPADAEPAKGVKQKRPRAKTNEGEAGPAKTRSRGGRGGRGGRGRKGISDKDADAAGEEAASPAGEESGGGEGDQAHAVGEPAEAPVQMQQPEGQQEAGTGQDGPTAAGPPEEEVSVPSFLAAAAVAGAEAEEEDYDA